MLDHSDFSAHRAAVQIVNGIAIRYRLTIDGPTVEATHSDLDRSLPEHSVRLSTGARELLMWSPEWAGRDDELRARVLTWLADHVELRGTRLRKARRADRMWSEAWRRANPAAR